MSILTTTNQTTLTSAQDILATVGLVRVIDTVLQILSDESKLSPTQNLSYIIGFDSQDNFLSVENRPFTDNLTDTWDLSYFVPNFAKALADFNVTGVITSDINEWGRYLAAEIRTITDVRKAVVGGVLVAVFALVCFVYRKKQKQREMTWKSQKWV